MSLKTCFHFYFMSKSHDLRVFFGKRNADLKLCQVPHLGNIVGSVLSADVFSRYAHFDKAP